MGRIAIGSLPIFAMLTLAGCEHLPGPRFVPADQPRETLSRVQNRRSDMVVSVDRPPDRSKGRCIDRSRGETWQGTVEAAPETANIAAESAPLPKMLSTHVAAQMCWDSAEGLAAHGRTDAAIRQFQQAVELDPTLAAKAARRCAPLFDKLGQTEKSWQTYQTALLESPNDVELLNEIGQFYLSHGGASEAEGWLRKAVQQNAQHREAWLNLAQALAAQGRNAEAGRILHKLLSPADARALLAKTSRPNELPQSDGSVVIIDSTNAVAQMPPSKPEAVAKSEPVVTPAPAEARAVEPVWTKSPERGISLEHR